MAKNNEVKKCLKCKKTIVGDSKFGLCSKCLGEVGTGGTIMIVLGAVSTGAKLIMKKMKK